MLKTVSSITNAIGALNYKGTWNASTNSPALTSSVGTKGDYYVVGTAGTTTLNGISNWGIGDWAVFNGSVWQRVEGGADLNGVNLSVSGTSTLGDNATFSTAAKGVNFSANTGAAGKTSSLLNWYEEGTFTPTFFGATSAGTTTYTTQSGYYTRIGRSVTCQIYISFSAATGTGAIRIGGLPFTQNANVNGTFSILVSGYDWASASYLSGFLFPSTTTLRVFGSSDNAGWQEQSVSNSSQIWAIAVTYFV